ncbi:MAG: glucosyltransferase domain-containing protein [Oscillibacter sp.]|nr:glucosyltransferase domain-containing protein [Oscillibacter sp.]
MSERVLKVLESAERCGKRWEARFRTAAKKYKEMFLAALCAGFAAYGFVMLNILNNQDNISNTPGGYGAGTASGRWFLEILAELTRKIWGVNTLPLFNGLLSVAFVALAACLTVSVLEIKSRPFSILIALLFVAFPSLAMTMLFMFTVGYYAFSLLLALCGVYAAKNFRGLAGILSGAVCLALSLGIYQAYLPIAAALFLLILLRRGFSEKELSGRDFFLQGVRFLAVLALGLAFYMAVLRLMLRFAGEDLNTYQGIDQMGAVSLPELPAMFAEAYKKFFALPFTEEYAINDPPVVRFAFLCSMILSAILFVWLELRVKADKAAKALNAAYFALFPAAAFGIVIMCYHSSIFGRMAYGAVTAFFLPLVLLEVAEGNGGAAARILRNGAASLLSALLFLASVSYVRQSNENYMVLDYTNRQTENYFASMVTRIRMVPGYRQDLFLAFIGDDIDDRAFSNEVYRRSAYIYGGYTDESNYKKAGKSYMSNYMGFRQPMASDAQASELAATDAVRAMPCYPDDGSIRVIGDYVVVKLENAG